MKILYTLGIWFQGRPHPPQPDNADEVYMPLVTLAASLPYANTQKLQKPIDHYILQKLNNR